MAVLSQRASFMTAEVGVLVVAFLQSSLSLQELLKLDFHICPSA